MLRASSLLFAVVALTSGAFADDKAEVSDAQAGPNRGRDAVETRAQLADQLAAELEVISTTLDTVAKRLADADAVRVARLRAAYRLLRAPLPSNASIEDRMSAARRRAASRLLVDRDAAERDLLAEEAAHLRAAAERTVVATGKLPTITLPSELARPVRGTIARKFGTLIHERSRATLSRRGIDLEVEPRATVTAPADGTVRYVGSIRGLDEGVILEHGDYLTVIAKLGDVVVPVGAPVRRGDRLGRAAHHRVYLEVRVRIGSGGIPIDPEPLLAASTDETR